MKESVYRTTPKIQRQTPITQQKQKVCAKFLEIQTMKQESARRSYSRTEQIKSSLITDRITEQIEAQHPSARVVHGSQGNFLGVVYHNSHSQSGVLTPIKNTHLFNKLREQYRDRYVNVSQQLADVDSRLKGQEPESDSPRPELHYSYARLYKNSQAQTPAQQDDSLNCFTNWSLMQDSVVKPDHHLLEVSEAAKIGQLTNKLKKQRRDKNARSVLQ